MRDTRGGELLGMKDEIRDQDTGMNWFFIPSCQTKMLSRPSLLQNIVVPVLEIPDGPVFESNAIARFVTRLKADNPLYGSWLIEYGRVALCRKAAAALNALPPQHANSTVTPHVTPVPWA
ncbi:Elongation factor 1-gamma 2 [Platanthera zijinensis]|uniref:Elongation factor 1-gamma 2 n=1 Tax=Platanthera zijinensis TaxID=2320716 RepID=A0AAP0GF08_9ASPA